MSELFDAVDALVASRSPLPPPAERKRLRQAHGLTLDEVAAALEVRRATVSGWEAGKTEPRPPEREAYARMLKQLAQFYPANAAPPLEDTEASETPASPAVSAPSAAEQTEACTRSTGPASQAASGNTTSGPVGSAAATRPVATTRPLPASHRPDTKRAALANTAAAGADSRFANGPLLVIDADDDGHVTGYGVGGLVLDVSAKSLPTLVEWALKEAQLGTPALHGSGKDADPLLVLRGHLDRQVVRRSALPVGTHGAGATMRACVS